MIGILIVSLQKPRATDFTIYNYLKEGTHNGLRAIRQGRVLGPESHSIWY